ncbi:hypothetical protein V8C34DRAFT_313819 [Trichoderma compactum]
MNQPEVTDANELEAALPERERWQGVWPAVRLKLTKSAIDRAFELVTELECFLKEKQQAQLRLILLETRQVTPSDKCPRQGEIISAAINPAMLRCLRKHAGLFNTFIEATCGIGHWYSAKHMCYSDDYKEQQYPKDFGTSMLKKHSCTQLSIAKSSATYFFLDLPGSVLARFLGDVAEDAKLSTRFFYIETLIADEAMRTWQKDIALKRTELKALEKTVDHSEVNNQSIHELHSLAWEWHILARNLSDYSALLKFFKSCTSRYYTITTVYANLSAREIIQLTATLEYLDSSCQSLTYLISDYSGRTKTRIDLLYHLANQAESQSTRELAELARQDSAAMLTIAAVTLLFLPGTFIAVRMSSSFTFISVRRLTVYI